MKTRDPGIHLYMATMMGGTYQLWGYTFNDITIVIGCVLCYIASWLMEPKIPYVIPISRSRTTAFGAVGSCQRCLGPRHAQASWNERGMVTHHMMGFLCVNITTPLSR